jgi:hypothetical protein
MPKHFETKPTEPPGCTIHSSVLSFSLHKVLVRGPNGLTQEDRLNMKGKILEPPELRSHRIDVELCKKQEIKAPLIEGYEAIGNLSFMKDDIDDPPPQIGKPAPPGHFVAAIDVDGKIYDDLANLLVSLEGHAGIDKESTLSVIGLLNNWDLGGRLPLTYFHLFAESKPKISSIQEYEECSPVKLIPPLVFHDED